MAEFFIVHGRARQVKAWRYILEVTKAKNIPEENEENEPFRKLSLNNIRLWY